MSLLEQKAENALEDRRAGEKAADSDRFKKHFAMQSIADGREMNSSETARPIDVDDDEPVTLREACQLFFKGRLTPSALRREAGRGNLNIIQIARKDFVTRRAIEEMKQLCLRSAAAPTLAPKGQPRRTLRPLVHPRHRRKRQATPHRTGRTEAAN